MWIFPCSQLAGVTRDKQILHTTVSEEAAKRASPSRATSSTKVHPAMAKDVITSKATTETAPCPHEATKGNISTRETGPGPHQATKGNVSTTETAPGPHEDTNGNVSTTETAPGPNEATKSNVSTLEAAPSRHVAINSNALTTAAVFATTKVVPIRKAQSSPTQEVSSPSKSSQPGKSVSAKEWTMPMTTAMPDTVTLAMCQFPMSQEQDEEVSNPQPEVMAHSTNESQIPSVSPSSITTAATELTFDLCCTVVDEVYPATFAELADEQLIRWMNLDQVALHPRDYPGIDKDITQEEFECRQKTLASLIYNEEEMQYTTLYRKCSKF